MQVTHIYSEFRFLVFKPPPFVLAVVPSCFVRWHELLTLDVSIYLILFRVEVLCLLFYSRSRMLLSGKVWDQLVHHHL